MRSFKWILSNNYTFVIATCCAVFIYFVILKGILDNGIITDTYKSSERTNFRTYTRNRNNSQGHIEPSTVKDNLCSSSARYSSRSLSGQLEEDILCFPPISFLKDYKNPCWKSDISGSLLCLPYFQLIGMDKCGTTDLFDRIVKHPEIIQNDGLKHKETGWWSWKRYGNTLMHNTKKQYFEDYLHDFFATAAATIEKFINITTGYHSLITGDGTPMDMWDFTGWPQIPQNRGLREPKYLTPHLIHHINPHKKFIILLRNPVDRLYSDYYFLNRYRRGNFSNLSFHLAAQESILKLKICEKTFSLRKCLYNRSLSFDFNRNTRIHLGFYSVFLKEWFSVFPREQFLILQTEEYSKYLYQEMNKIFKFLNVHRLSEEEMNNYGMFTSEHKRETKIKKKAEPMLEETREILYKVYQPYIKELYELLQDKQFVWDFNV